MSRTYFYSKYHKYVVEDTTISFNFFGHNRFKLAEKSTDFGLIFDRWCIFYYFIVRRKLNNLLIISSKYPYGKNTVESNAKKK
jgi:hypothetical protein